MSTGVDDAIRRQLQIGKKRPGLGYDDGDDNEQSPQADMVANETVPVEDVPPGKAFGPGAVEGPVAPDQGPLAKLNTEPKISSRQTHPDPIIERGLRILGDLDMHNAEHESEIERLSSKPGGIQHPDDQKEFENRSAEIERNKRARSALLKTVVGLSDAYYAKTGEQPEQKDTGEGFLSKAGGVLKTIGKGALETGKYAFQHPIEAAKDVGAGTYKLATLPERALGGLFPNVPLLNRAGKTVGKQEEYLKKSHAESGVAPENVGPDVMSAVGESVMPVGPALKSGEMLKNVVKGGATTVGFYAGEKTAAREDITPEGLAGSAAVGSGLAGLLGKFMRGRASAKEAAEPSAGGAGAPEPTPHGSPPGAGTVEPPLAPLQIPEREGGTIYAGGPPLQLPAPNTPAAAIPEGAVEIPVSPYMRQFTKVWRTPDGSLIGETRGGEIIRADKQPTSPSISDKPDRSMLQRLVDADKLQQQTVGAQPKPGAPEPKVPEQPFSGAPRPEGDLQAAPMPGAQAPSPLQSIIPKAPEAAPSVQQPSPQMHPAMQAAPQEVVQAKPQGVGAPQAGVPQLRAVNPTPESQQNVSILKQIMGSGEPQPKVPYTEEGIRERGKQSSEDIRAANKPVPKITSAKSGTTAQAKKPSGNMDLLKWARTNEYEVREFPGTGKVEIRNPLTGEKVVEFNSKDPTSRAKAAARMQQVESADEESTIKLYSGVDVGEAAKGAKRLYDELKARGSALLGEGHDEQTPLIRGLKTGVAIERGGGISGKIVTNANEAERMTHKVVEDLRYEAKPEGGYKETQFEVFMRMPESERAPVDRVIRDFDKLEKIPSPEELAKTDHEYLRLTPAQKAAVHGTQEFADKVHKYIQSEIKERILMSLGKKTGEFTPKAYKEWLSKLPDEERKTLESLEVGIGKKEFYYPHTWSGHFEVHEVDPGTGIPSSRKYLAPFEGSRTGEGSSSVRTLYQANRLKQRAVEEWGVPTENVKVIVRDQPGASKYLETRKGALGYEQENIADTYLNYARSVAHWVEMSKLQRVAGDLLKDPKLSNSDKGFLTKYVDRVAGRPAAQDMVLNHLLQHVPVLRNALDPFVPFSHVAKGARQFATATALGVFNAASALVNADGVARHVWPALARLSNELKLPALSAEKYGASAIKAWSSSTSQTALDKLASFDRSKTFADQLSKALNLDKKNKDLLQKMAHEGVLDLQIFGERLPPTEKKSQAAMRGMLALFATTEDFSRGVASVAAYRMARDAGLNEAASLQKAFQLTSSALGRYSKAGKPMVYSSELGGTLGIFKTYLHVMWYNAYLNMRHPVKDFGAFARYALAAIGMSGLTGLYPGTSDVDGLATKAFGVSPQAWLHKNLPLWVVDGIPTLFGTDLSNRAGAPEVVPNKGEDWLGAVYSKVAKPIGSLALAAYQNSIRGLEGEPTSFLDDVLPALKQAAPNTVGLRYLLQEADDRLKGSRERTIIKDLTPEEKAIKILGLPVNREVQARQQYQVGENLKEKWGEERKRLVDLFIDKDEQTTKDWSALSHKYGITPRMVHEEMKRKNQTLSQRQRKTLPKSLRREVDFDQPEF